MEVIMLTIILSLATVFQIINLIYNLRLFRKHAGVKRIDVLLNPSILTWLKKNNINLYR